MAKITYVQFDGKEHVLMCLLGYPSCKAPIGNNVRGVIAECGGACSCATCHVYVDEAWVDKVPEKSEAGESHARGRVRSSAEQSPFLPDQSDRGSQGLIVRLP